MDQMAVFSYFSRIRICKIPHILRYNKLKRIGFLLFFCQKFIVNSRHLFVHVFKGSFTCTSPIAQIPKC